ncbi:MAG: hypothetical protein PF439_01545 [Helicobacteraceae bacterium]|jgi:hypothetical protein|nr:hypothetical protein [Helicobacteraceae bacterium]
MKIKSIITLALLFAIGFSSVHAYVFAFYDEEHLSAVEYVSQLQAPSSHGDICDVHFEYHQAFLLPQNSAIPDAKQLSFAETSQDESYCFQTHLDFFKPPIS